VRNRGIERAKGDYIIFLDGDCIAQRDFVAAHRRLAESGRVVTGSRILLNPDLTQQIIAGLPILDRGMAFWWARRVRGQVNKVLPLFLHLPDLRLRRQSDFVWRGIKSCNLAVWRSDAKAVNGFDETFTGWGHEDADFVARLFNHGILRKKGFYATEVLHLWHREATRDSESPNRARVQERLKSRQFRAERGLAEA
jgi:GT2 family glycosyltransferase